MSFLDRVFGSKPAAAPREPHGVATPSADDQAIARYRYLLRTAPPEAIEQAHAEAFAQLTPEQRAQVLRQLSAELPEAEVAAGPQQADPQALARMATRAELRQPGVLERMFGSGGSAPGGFAPGGMGLGGMMAGTLLSSIAGTFIGSAIAHEFLGGFDRSPEAGLADSNASHGLAGEDAQYADSSGGDAHTDNSNAAADDWDSDQGGDDFEGDDFAGDDFEV